MQCTTSKPVRTNHTPNNVVRSCGTKENHLDFFPSVIMCDTVTAHPVGIQYSGILRQMPSHSTGAPHVKIVHLTPSWTIEPLTYHSSVQIRDSRGVCKSLLGSMLCRRLFLLPSLGTHLVADVCTRDTSVTHTKSYPFETGVPTFTSHPSLYSVDMLH